MQAWWLDSIMHSQIIELRMKYMSWFMAFCLISAVCPDTAHVDIREHTEVVKEEINIHKQQAHVDLRDHTEVVKEEINIHKEQAHVDIREHTEVGKKEIEFKTGTVLQYT